MVAADFLWEGCLRGDVRKGDILLVDVMLMQHRREDVLRRVGDVDERESVSKQKTRTQDWPSVFLCQAVSGVPVF